VVSVARGHLSIYCLTWQPGLFAGIADPGYSILDTRSWMLDAGCSMLDARCWMLDAGCWMLDTGCSILDAGYFMAYGSRRKQLIEFIGLIELIELNYISNQPLTIHSISFPRRFNPKS
jgi:hypothetical protein